jgi:hypothetical protein
MAVSVDNVYQKVLVLANKEQRGYITPQEFNLLASQAQLDIFENYFFDLEKALRAPANDTVYADKVDSLREKIEVHQKFNQSCSVTSNGLYNLPGGTSTYKLSKVYSTGLKEIQLVPQNELNHYLNNNLLKPTVERPVYVRTTVGSIQVYPTSYNAALSCNYIEKPAEPNWAYVVVNKKALFNNTAKVDFDLHEGEENNLVIKILELAGVTIKNPDVSGYALQDRAAKDNKKNS